jgi:hypothetical protein
VSPAPRIEEELDARRPLGSCCPEPFPSEECPVPPAKKATKKKSIKKTTTKKKVAKKKSATKRPQKSMSAAHKLALAAGRNDSAAVSRYLDALNTPKRRGRKVSAATLRTRLRNAEERATSAVGVARVLAHQDIRDLRARLARSGESAAGDIKRLEQAFVQVAKRFAERRGISYAAWRDAGVPADVLKRTGIPRTRG